MKLLRKAAVVWTKIEGALLIIGIPVGFLVWAYSNFATAKEMSDVKNELRAYVDQRHSEVKDDLLDIKSEQLTQRKLQERILLEIRN